MLFSSRSSYGSPSIGLRPKAIIVLTSIFILLVFFVYATLPTGGCNPYSDAVVCRVSDKAKHMLPQTEVWRPTELKDVKSKFAFATFLAGAADTTDGDPFFIGVRILTYQLLHSEETRSRDRSIPLIVLVTEAVSESKRDRLRKDGAIVVPAITIDPKWVAAKTQKVSWKDVMTKFRLWELTQFDRICQLDGDTVLAKPMDGVFQDPATDLQKTLDQPGAIKPGEGEMPLDYSFAGYPELNMKHEFPPTEANHGFVNYWYINAGFFVFKPSLAMLNYYLSLLELPGTFDGGLPEQDLLNYAHRKEGNMPMTHMGNTWNIHMAQLADVEAGVASVHAKWWAPLNDTLKPWMESKRWQMEGYFAAMDEMRTSQ